MNSDSPPTPLRVLITGASGMIGSALAAHLHEDGHEILRVTRNPSHPGDISWDPDEGKLDLSSAGPIDAAVHLAGENIAAGRWTDARKRRILESRRAGTRLLSEALAALSPPPKVLVSASGINYYPANTGQTHDESSPPGDDFLAQVCLEWEAGTTAAREAGIRVVILRLGMVLSPRGGALAKMLPLFKLGQGGRLGLGKQRVSWIALEDVVEIMARALTDARYEGALNAVAPQVVTNAEFTRALAKTLHRPAILPAPAFALRLALGEMADALLLADLAVTPGRLQELGYPFRHPDLEEAFAAVLR